jgi:cephalosporin hydroxylase
VTSVAPVTGHPHVRPVRRALAAGLGSYRPNPVIITKRLVAAALGHWLYQPTGNEPHDYHRWYYNTGVWNKTTWMGVKCWKSTSDMWNYQEILVDIGPSLVVEFGTYRGASAIYFASVLRSIGKPFKVLSVDIYGGRVSPQARRDPDIMFLESSSTDPEVSDHIGALKAEFPGPIFAILDSDHSRDHVLAEMKLLRPLLVSGDYLVVEDSQLNGHPVLPGFGPGPFEAIQAYEAEFPLDYRHDREREQKFGWTQAPSGFLIRN